MVFNQCLYDLKNGWSHRYNYPKAYKLISMGKKKYIIFLHKLSQHTIFRWINGKVEFSKTFLLQGSNIIPFFQSQPVTSATPRVRVLKLCYHQYLLRRSVSKIIGSASLMFLFISTCIWRRTVQIMRYRLHTNIRN